jgi:hypothetical protein
MHPTFALSGARAIKTLFYLEMALSPVVTGVAYVAIVAANWGAFKYIPAVLWLVLLVQCVFTFRWRGLWFLLGPPVAFLAIVLFLMAAPPVPRRDLQDPSEPSLTPQSQMFHEVHSTALSKTVTQLRTSKSADGKVKRGGSVGISPRLTV